MRGDAHSDPPLSAWAVVALSVFFVVVVGGFIWLMWVQTGGAVGLLLPVAVVLLLVAGFYFRDRWPRALASLLGGRRSHHGPRTAAPTVGSVREAMSMAEMDALLGRIADRHEPQRTRGEQAKVLLRDWSQVPSDYRRALEGLTGWSENELLAMLARSAAVEDTSLRDG